jgi:cytochrome c-type biogenesis protein CcmH/NrfG
MLRNLLLALFVVSLSVCSNGSDNPTIPGQTHTAIGEQVRVSPPGLRHADPPSPTATVDELETRADQLRSEKAYMDALDYYRAAISKDTGNARLHNKAGISQLMLQRYKDAERSFERAVKLDRSFADAYNNLGVILYEEKKFPKAIKTYEKAIQLRQDSASFYNNLGAAYYMKKEWAQATDAYGRALQLDPDIFGRISHSGVSAQLPSPQERARFDYLVAKLYAKQGDPDRSLEYLRRCLEEGYPKISDVYKDPEFTGLRSDSRFSQLMASKPPAIPE